MSLSRELVRDTFASLVTTAAVGTGKPAEAVYNYQVGDFANKSPIIVVASGPIQRSKSDMSGECWRSIIILQVYIFVLYAGENWTEAQAEDALDEIEAIIADVVLANPYVPGVWNYCTYAEEPTQIDGVTVGGLEYKRELINVMFEVLEG